VFVIENGPSHNNYVKYIIQKSEEGYTDLCDAVRNDLKIKNDFEMYDKNGSKIYVEDFHHLYENSCIYI
jgi:hypothetical protein